MGAAASRRLLVYDILPLTDGFAACQRGLLMLFPSKINEQLVQDACDQAAERFGV